MAFAAWPKKARAIGAGDRASAGDRAGAGAGAGDRAGAGGRGQGQGQARARAIGTKKGPHNGGPESFGICCGLIEQSHKPAFNRPLYHKRGLVLRFDIFGNPCIPLPYLRAQCLNMLHLFPLFGR